MHPVRRNIVIRWGFYAVALIALGVVIYYQQDRRPTFRASAIERLAPAEIELPPENVVQTVDTAIEILQGKIAAFPSVKDVDPELIILSEEEAEESLAPRVPLNVSTIFLGPPKKFVIINGVVYQEGEKLPDGREVKTIDSDGVLVLDNEVTERVAWVPPFRVELKEPEREKTKVFKPEEDLPEEVDAPPEEAGGKIDIENLPPSLTPDQALQVLQQLGRVNQ